MVSPSPASLSFPPPPWRSIIHAHPNFTLPFLLLILSSPSSASSSFFSSGSFSSVSFSSSFSFSFSSSPLSSCKQLSLIAATHLYVPVELFTTACRAYQWPTLRKNGPSPHQLSTADSSPVMNRTQRIPPKFMQRFCMTWYWADFSMNVHIYSHVMFRRQHLPAHLSILGFYSLFPSSSLVLLCHAVCVFAINLSHLDMSTGSLHLLAALWFHLWLFTLQRRYFYDQIWECSRPRGLKANIWKAVL